MQTQTTNKLPGMDLVKETLRGSFCIDAVSNPNPGFYNMEEWMVIYGFEEYDVSNHGRIRSWKSGNPEILKPHIGKEGYCTISLYDVKEQSVKRVHRLVALAFIPNPENKSEVNHKDGDKSNNRIGNLEWCTKSENELHAYKIGLKNAKGGNNGRSKLNEFQVRVIRKCNNLSHVELGKIFNISRPVITLIKNNKIWMK